MIEYQSGGGIARITLNRPEKRNAMNAELLSALKAALSRADTDDAVRVILLRGAGNDFCAGLDLAGMVQSPDDALAHFKTANELAELYVQMRRNRKPIVGAVQGRAIGGGAGLATACDLVLAAESAQLSYPEVNLGFIAAIVVSLLRRQVGEKRAFEIVALAEPLPAPRALSLGIINRVFGDSEFDSQTEAFVTSLASKSASALSLTKDVVYHIDGMSFESAIHAGAYANVLARLTPDARAGFEKFVKKQK